MHFMCVYECAHIVADTPLLTETSFVQVLDQGIFDLREGRLLSQLQSIMIDSNQ